MKFRAKHLFIPLLLLSAVIQCAFARFPVCLLRLPAGCTHSPVWIAAMVYAYKENHSSPLVRMWLSPQCTYWTLG